MNGYVDTNSKGCWEERGRQLENSGCTPLIYHKRQNGVKREKKDI